MKSKDKNRCMVFIGLYIIIVEKEDTKKVVNNIEKENRIEI